MDPNKLFVHKRYLGELGDDYPIYFNRNGTLKRGILSLFNKSALQDEDYWYCYDDIPAAMQAAVHDVAISFEDFLNLSKQSPGKAATVLDSDEVSVVVNDGTPVLPIVGNILPTDGTNAFTVIYKDDKLYLKPIVVCWGCHWSELFTGCTKYGSNVFCLASDLDTQTIEAFLDDIIFLGDVPAYLESIGEEEKIKKMC